MNSSRNSFYLFFLNCLPEIMVPKKVMSPFLFVSFKWNHAHLFFIYSWWHHFHRAEKKDKTHSFNNTLYNHGTFKLSSSQTNKQKIRQMEASSNKSTSEAMLTRLLWYEKAQTLIVHYPLHCFYLKWELHNTV